MSITPEDIERIVAAVLDRLKRPEGGPAPARAEGAVPAGDGVFATMDEACRAAHEAQRRLVERSLEVRDRIIRAIRKVGVDHAEDFSRRTVAETGMGRYEHNIRKHVDVATRTPGIEDLHPECFTGDHGLTVDERAPYGVIGAVTPSTHPVPTLLNNAIGMIAAGNAVVFNPHPASTRVFTYAIGLVNRAMQEAGAPPDLVTCVTRPTIETGQEMFRHPLVRLLVVTGGPAVVQVALQSNKKAITAGPGNPPVVVDETADLDRAARAIVAGASFDNNIICIAEKEVFVVASVADALIERMVAEHCVLLEAAQMDRLAQVAFQLDGAGCGSPRLARELVGRNADVLARAIGLSVPPDTLLLIGETGPDHPFVVEEQMMPVLPIVRCRNVWEAIERAIAAEGGRFHTAVMHSRNVEYMSEMARRVNTTIFVKNGPSFAGLGIGGEGRLSYSIASPTGEGLTTARTFTRQRRCVLVDYFRFV